MSESQWQNNVVPARLAFLAIYNPSLGPTDETFKEQLVFYYSRNTQDARSTAAKHARIDAAGGDAQQAEENEQLRHIGLAQGMVNFARSFSDGKPVDSIDTDKSRIVLQELDKGWWILASIDLTRLPSMPHGSSSASKKSSEKDESMSSPEYSSREVSPPALLLSQLSQAHAIFALHHGSLLTELYVKQTREKFCAMLDRYWTRFARSWDVLLHGNPATDIFCGLKLSSGGELGMGVGEEEWGSGERDVLEDLARRTNGLIDLVVSRFGDAASSQGEASQDESVNVPWLGSGNHPLASDGVIFGGINAISRVSLRNLSLWMRQIYIYGEHAHGVRDNPHRERRKRRRPNPPEPSLPQPASQSNASPAAEIENTGAQDHEAERRLGVPPPIVSVNSESGVTIRNAAETGSEQHETASTDDAGTTLGIPDQYMKYLTFGLSTLAKPSTQKRPGLASRKSSAISQKLGIPARRARSSAPKQEQSADPDRDFGDLTQVDPLPDGQNRRDRIAAQKRQEEQGQFVIGLKGDLNDVPDDPDVSIEDVDDESAGVRNILRTLQIEVVRTAKNQEHKTELQRKLIDAGLTSARNDPLNFKRLRVLVYVRRPFIYCFLFEDRTPSLGMAGFYKTLHQSLEPIYKPLLASTSVARIAQRIEDAQAQASGAASDSASITSAGKSYKAPEPKPIYDLIWDPALLTVHTSIPNIPEPGTLAAEGMSSSNVSQSPHSPDWTRVDALNVHSQILNTLSNTQRSVHEYERTSKTSRGWWIVWLKLPPSRTSETSAGKEAERYQNFTKQSGKEDASAASELPRPLQRLMSDDSVQSSAQTSSMSQHTTRLESTVATTARVQQPMYRIAFLVRKATDAVAPLKSDVTSRAVSSMWQTLSLRSASTIEDSTGGSRAGWGPGALASGIGIDARKYVEGLLQLNR